MMRSDGRVAVMAHGLRLSAGRWRRSGVAAAREALDDDHATAAARTRRPPIGWGGSIGANGSAAFIIGVGRGEQFANMRDVGFAAAAGKQTVVADAMESLWQDVKQEAADELA
jgi:hypothetical protein